VTGSRLRGWDGSSATGAAERVPAFHLVVYSDAQERGGAEMTLAQLLAGLPERVRVTIVAVNDDVAEFLSSHRPGTSVELTEPIESKADLRRMLTHRRLFRQLRPDVVQFNLSMVSSCQWAIAVALTLPEAKVLVTENASMGAWSRTSNLLKKLTSPRLAGHVAVGEATARIIEREAGLADGSIGTMHHGVADVRQDVPKAPNTILNVARHDPVKGVDVLLRAMPLVDPSIRLVQIGGGPLLDEHKRLAEDLGVADRVDFRDLRWDERVADLMSGFQLFVLSSRTEGLPVTVMEAMLAGLPIIASDVGSVREEVTDGENGLVVPPDDPKALAAAIDELMADDERRVSMGRRSREVAEQLFTLESMVERYCSVYERILGPVH
jgi:glycosyltransferase involved in cell wall biosynthesis